MGAGVGWVARARGVMQCRMRALDGMQTRVV
jgi:hypothetical protein